jgi:protein-L-isoaspartate(D-aspartate) O-methyltransferase
VCIEIDPAVFEEGRRYVERSGFKNVILVLGDGGLGYPDKAPYDRICITAACVEVPPPLFEQPRPEKAHRACDKGRGSDIVLFEKDERGIEEKIVEDFLLNIPYVQMKGEYGT